MNQAEGRADTAQALRASEDRYRQLIELAPDAIAIIQRGRIVFANPATVRLLGGHGPGDVVGRELNADIHPDDLPGSQERQREVLVSGTPSQLSRVRIRRLDGAYVPVEVRGVRCEFNGEIAIQLIARDISQGDRGERQLRDSEARLAEAQELGGIGSFEVELSTGVVTATPALHRIFGFPPDADPMEFGPFVETHVHPADRERAYASRDRAPVPGEVDSIEYRYLHPDGSERVMQMHRRVVADGEGRPHRILCTVQDITERTRTEERLRASEERYRVFVDHATDAIFLHHYNGSVFDVNQHACEMLGYTREELIGQMPSAFDPSFTEANMRHALDTLDHMQTVSFESIHRRKDGTTYPVEVRIRPFWLGDERVGLSLARDISQRKHAELALRRSEETLRKAQQIAHIGNWTIDVSTNRFHASDEMRRLIDLEDSGADSVDAAEIFRRIHPDDLPRALDAWRRATEGEPVELEHRGFVGGQVRWFYSATTVERDAAGRPTFVIGVSQDITARRRLEEQFQQAQKMEAVGKLAGGVAHDFNNMLTVINGYTDMLLAELELYDPRREKITQVREAGERAAALTRQLLAFSRKQILAPRLVNLNDIVTRAEGMLRRLIGEDVTVSTHLEPDLAQLKADPSQLEQVLLNLAVNARDAMPQGGQLSVRTRTVMVQRGSQPHLADVSPGRYVELTVADTGCGMSPDVRDKVFEPFFTTKPTGTGTGLGLSTVYGIVKQSGGHIWVDSDMGVGSTFGILLPAAPDDAVSLPVAESLDVSLRGSETVLIVEDEDAVRRVARTALEMHGYRVIDASGGDEARRLAARHEGPIHLVVTDVVMAEMSGRDVADLLRALRPGIRVLFMSGYTDDAVVRHGVLDATDHFLQKPFTPQTLARRVRAVLDEPASR